MVKSLVKVWGPRPFRTIDVWYLKSGFKELVKDKWKSYYVQGNDMMKFKDKLKSLMVDLKVWNRDVFGNLDTNKKKNLKEIDDLDSQDDQGELEESARLKRMGLVS